MTQYTDGLNVEQTATGSGSLDNIRTTSYKMVSGNVTSFPSGESGYAFVKTMSYNNDNAVSQELTMVNNAHTYIRTYSNQQWTSWVKLGGVTKDYKWFSPTAANTYEYTNIAITVPPLSYIRISVSQGWYNGAPTGILVSTAATVSEISVYNTLNKVEQQEGSLTRKLLDLTIFAFNSSATTTDTYYIYAKKLSANQANPLSYCIEFL